jgi:hypothetical protein
VQVLRDGSRAHRERHIDVTRVAIPLNARNTRCAKQNKHVAVLTAPDGTVWSINRRLWSFPGDALDLTFGLFEVIISVLFALLWPFWLLAKFCGVRWVITVERNGHQVGRELVRGWNSSKRRVDEIAREVVAGGRSGHFTL